MAGRRDRRDIGVIVLLAALAYGWSLFHPIADAHSFRQTWTASTVRLFAREGIDLLEPRVDYIDPTGPTPVALEFPAYQALVALLYRTFGEHEILGRSVSALFGLGAALVLYLALRRIASREAGFAAAVVALASPVNLLYGRAFLPDSMGVFLALLFFALALRILLEPRRRLLDVAALAIVGPLAATVKPPYLLPFLGGLAGVLLATVFGERRADPRRLASIGGALVVPIATTLLAAAAWRHHADQINLAQGRLDDVISRFPAWYFFRAEQLSDPPTIGRLLLRIGLTLGPAGIVLAVPGAREIGRRLREPWGATAAGLAAGSAIYLVLFLNLNVVHQYYHLPLAFALAPTIAAPLAFPRPGGALERFSRRPAAFVPVLAASALAGLLAVAWVRTEVTRIGFPYDRDLVAVGRDFRSVIGEGRPLTLFVVPSLEAHDPHEVLYFADTRGFVTRTVDAGSLARMMGRGVRVVAVERGPGTAEDERTVTEYPGLRPVGRTERLAVFEVAAR